MANGQTVPQTLPANFSNWDTPAPAANPPGKLPANFKGWDASPPTAAPTGPAGGATTSWEPEKPGITERVAATLPEWAFPPMRFVQKYVNQPLDTMAQQGGQALRSDAEDAVTSLTQPAPQRVVNPQPEDYYRGGGAPPSKYLPLTEAQQQERTQKAKQEYPITMGLAGGAGELLGGMAADPRQWMMALGGEALPVMQKLMSAGFSAQMLADAYQKYPEIKAAAEKGDVYETSRLLTHFAGDVGFGTAAALHATAPIRNAAGQKIADVAQPVREGVADALRESASKQEQQVLTQGGGTRKEKATAARVAPQMAERGVTALTRGGLEEKAGQQADIVGKQLEDAYNQLPQNSKLATQPLLDHFEQAKQDFIAQDSGQVLDQNALDRIDTLKQIVQKFGPDVSVNDIVQLRRIWDQQVAASGPGHLLPAEETTGIAIKREAANAIRSELAKQFPDIDKINKEFSFWKGVHDVMSATNARKGGHSWLSMQDLLLSGSGLGGAVAKGLGLVGAAKTGGGLLLLSKAMKSTGWNTVSAAIKSRIADMLADGNVAGAAKAAQAATGGGGAGPTSLPPTILKPPPGGGGAAPNVPPFANAGQARGAAAGAGGGQLQLGLTPSQQAGFPEATVTPAPPAQTPPAPVAPSFANLGQPRQTPAPAENVAAAAPEPPQTTSQPPATPPEAPVPETRPKAPVRQQGARLTGQDGKETRVLTPSGRELPGRYRVVEGDTLTTSHNPETFAKNPAYPQGVQERTYHSSKEAQARVIDQEQKFKPDFILNTDPSGQNGPPIMTPDGTVLGGNSRVMTTQRLYGHGTGDAYKNALIEQAGQFGLDPEQIRGMKNPTLVREIDAPTSTDELRRIGSDLNKPTSGALGTSERAVSAGKSLRPESLQQISDLQKQLGEDASLRDLLSKNPKPVLDLLQRDGVVGERERPGMTDAKTGGLSEDGKNFVEKALLGSAVDDPDLMDRTPKNVLNKLGGSLGDLAGISGRGDQYNIMPLIRAALQEHVAAADQGGPLEDYLNQRTMFGAERSPVVETLARSLGGSVKNFREAIRSFAEDARRDVAGQGMMPGMVQETPSAVNAFNHAFGTKFTEQQFDDALMQHSDIQIEEAEPSPTSVNASGESEASQEAINRRASEQRQGIKRYRLDTRYTPAREIPLLGPEAVDATAGPHEVIVRRHPDGREEILDQGAKARMRPLPPKPTKK